LRISLDYIGYKIKQNGLGSAHKAHSFFYRRNKMIKFIKNFGIYFLELAFLFMLFGFAWFLLVVFG